MSYELTYHTTDGEEHTITIAHPIASGVIVLADLLHDQACQIADAAYDAQRTPEARYDAHKAFKQDWHAAVMAEGGVG